MKTVRVGIVGAGRVADTHHLPVLALMPDVELAWICYLNRARAAKLARSYGIDEVQEKIAACSDVDVPLLATPIALVESIAPDREPKLREGLFQSFKRWSLPDRILRA
jgi:predicted dehydrogenase